jgi:hypothetical protein
MTSRLFPSAVLSRAGKGKEKGGGKGNPKIPVCGSANEKMLRSRILLLPVNGTSGDMTVR